MHESLTYRVKGRTSDISGLPGIAYSIEMVDRDVITTVIIDTKDRKILREKLNGDVPGSSVC